MGRYFSEYFIDSEPVPMDENAALDGGSYILEVTPADGPHHLRRVHDGDLMFVSYRDTEPTPEILAYQQRAYPGVEFRIATALVREGDTKRWTEWTYAGDGSLDRRSDYVQEPRRTLDTWFGADGKLGGKLERFYDEHGEETRVVEHGPDGRVLVHD